MDGCEVQYSIAASGDSTIAVEVMRTRLFQKQKCFFCFEQFRGGLKYVEGEPGKSRLSVEINAASITCRDRRLGPRKQRRLTSSAKRLCEGAGRSSISFHSKEVVAKPLRGFVISGSLALDGKVRDFRTNVMFAAASRESIEIEGDAVIRLSEVGIKVPSSLFGLVKVDDEALVQFRMQAVRIREELPLGLRRE